AAHDQAGLLVRRRARRGAEGAGGRSGRRAEGSRVLRHAQRRPHPERRVDVRGRLQGNARASPPPTPRVGSLSIMEMQDKKQLAAAPEGPTAPMTMIQALRSAMD